MASLADATRGASGELKDKLKRQFDKSSGPADDSMSEHAHGAESDGSSNSSAIRQEDGRAVAGVRRRRFVRSRRKDRDEELARLYCAAEAKRRKHIMEAVPRKPDDGAQYPSWPEPPERPVYHPHVVRARSRARQKWQAAQAERDAAQLERDARVEGRARALAEATRRPAVRAPGLKHYEKRAGMEDQDFPWLPSAGGTNKVTWWAVEGFLGQCKGGSADDVDVDDDD